MEWVGDVREHPLDGRTNDVPMTALCGTIEIDLRKMLNGSDLLKPVQAQEHTALKTNWIRQVTSKKVIEVPCCIENLMVVDANAIPRRPYIESASSIGRVLHHASALP